MPKLGSLPPTDAAFHENLKRAHLQTYLWKNALTLQPEMLDPLEYGWKQQGDMLCPIMIPEGAKLIPEYIQKIVSFSCKSKTPCEANRCGCSKAGVPCSVFCLCQQHDAPSSCHNHYNTVSHDSDTESDEEEIGEQ